MMAILSTGGKRTSGASGTDNPGDGVTPSPSGKSSRTMFPLRTSKPKRSMGRQQTRQLFEEARKAPAIGGCVELKMPHSEFLLPPEVVLFEPCPEEVFQGGQAAVGRRQIFLNTPLSDDEVKKLGDLHQALRDEALVTDQGDANFPEYVNLHALRLLQYRKFNVPKTLDLILLHLEERVKRLPIAEHDVMKELKQGFMYWHGRDRKCRPCLIIRMEQMGDLNVDKERAVRLVIFVLEYALRYAMVPGRVENWVVILDLLNASKVVSMFHLSSLAATAKMIATTLESVYCGRMVWMKIINMPGVMRKVIESCIPTEKKKKIGFPQNVPGELLQHFEPNQLERRYGGTAPDLAPSATYPFHFFPGAVEKATGGGQSLHLETPRVFHEGKLWDTSTPESKKQWTQAMEAVSLPPTAATALSGIIGGKTVKPCRDMKRWLQLIRGDEESATEGDCASDRALLGSITIEAMASPTPSELCAAAAKVAEPEAAKPMVSKKDNIMTL